LANAAKEGRSIEEIGDIADTFQENIVDMITDPAKLGLGRLAGLGPDVANAFGELVLSPIGQATKGMIAEMQTNGTEFKNASDVLVKIRESAQKEMDVARGDAKTTGQQINQTFKDIQDDLKESGIVLNNFLTGPDGLVHTGGLVKDSFKLASEAAGGLSEGLVELLGSEGAMEGAIKTAKGLFSDEPKEEPAKLTEADAKNANQKSQYENAVMAPPTGNPAKDIERQMALKIQSQKELTSFLENLNTSIQKSTDPANAEQLRLAAHTLKELSEQEDATFYSDIWPQLKKLGDTGPEIIRAAKTQTNSANAMTALIEAAGINKEDATSIITAVNQRISEDTGINEERGYADQFMNWVDSFGTSYEDAIAQTNSLIQTQTTITADLMKDRHSEVMDVVEISSLSTNTFMKDRYDQTMNRFDDSFSGIISQVDKSVTASTASTIDGIMDETKPVQIDTSSLESGIDDIIKINTPVETAPVVQEVDVKKAQQQTDPKINEFTQKFLSKQEAPVEVQETTINQLIKIDESINKLTEVTTKSQQLTEKLTAIGDYQAQQLHKTNQHLGTKPSATLKVLS
jgi:hypothetical protein